MKIHFIGIGGIGVSSLAQYYFKKGCKVSGSDLVSSEVTSKLKKEGVEIFIGNHKKDNISKNTDLVIHSPAIKKENPELQQALKHEIPIKSYPQALGDLTEKHFTIAVAGTHGKSTTSSIISLLLEKSGFDPTVIVGTKLREFNNSNFKAGNSKYLIIEADEHFASFLNYKPNIIVLTNIEKDHLDYYKNLNNILKTFKNFINLLPGNGLLIWNADDKNIPKIIDSKTKNKSYSLKQTEAKKIKKILKVPGEHNVSNALAVMSLARELKIKDKKTLKTLSDYKGSWRRFQMKESDFHGKKITVVSDYAHHPTEIKKTIKAAKEKFKERKIWVIFQPHQHQRTFYLFDEFIESFDEADEIILTDIYEVRGREKKSIKISSKELVKEIKKRGKKINLIKDFEKIPDFLKNKINSDEVVLVMGAGSIYKLHDKF